MKILLSNKLLWISNCCNFSPWKQAVRGRACQGRRRKDHHHRGGGRGWLGHNHYAQVKLQSLVFMLFQDKNCSNIRKSHVLSHLVGCACDIKSILKRNASVMDAQELGESHVQKSISTSYGSSTKVYGKMRLRLSTTRQYSTMPRPGIEPGTFRSSV